MLKNLNMKKSNCTHFFVKSIITPRSATESQINVCCNTGFKNFYMIMRLSYETPIDANPDITVREFTEKLRNATEMSLTSA